MFYCYKVIKCIKIILNKENIMIVLLYEIYGMESVFYNGIIMLLIFFDMFYMV